MSFDLHQIFKHQGFDIHTMLKQQIVVKASDLHLYEGKHPYFRMPNGDLSQVPLKGELDKKELKAVLNTFFSPAQISALEKNGVTETSTLYEGFRFRINVYRGMNGLSMVFRMLKFDEEEREILGIHNLIKKLSHLTHGLIVISGENGSGKTTTLTHLIKEINDTRKANIITMEDPVETLFEDNQSVITQIEIGTHLPSFEGASKYLFRQDVNVVVLGEARDLPSFRTALNMAATGHLVITTMHADDIESTIVRLISSFNDNEQNMMRLNLAYSLQAIISQRLIPNKTHDARLLACEVYLKQESTSSIILKDDLKALRQQMETNVSSGMTTFERSFEKLYDRSLISKSQFENYIKGK